MTVELPPQVQQVVDKVDAFMAKYPAATQYGRFQGQATVDAWASVTQKCWSARSKKIF